MSKLFNRSFLFLLIGIAYFFLPDPFPGFIDDILVNIFLQWLDNVLGK